MKKHLKGNRYLILLIVSFIGLTLLTYWIVRFYYPEWVFNTLMEMQPGYLLFNEKLNRSNFGDMYGPLNALFSGIGIIGLIITISIQIYLYHDDKNTIRRENEDEEKQILYYMWFRLNTIVESINRTLLESKQTIIKYKNREEFKNITISSPYSDKIFHKRYLDLLDAINIEKNHLVYLKYQNDMGFIQLFDLIPDCMERILIIIGKVNYIFRGNEQYRYDFEFLKVVIFIYEKINNFLETNNDPPDSIKSIKRCFDLHIDSIKNNKIPFTKMLAFLQECLSYAENEVTYPPFFNNLNELEERMHYSESDTNYRSIEELDGFIGKLNMDIIQINIILSKMKEKSKVPESV